MERSHAARLVSVGLFMLSVIVLRGNVQAEVEELHGAAALLHETEAVEAAPTPAPPYVSAATRVDEEVEKLTEDIAAFASAQPAPPKEAANAWMELLARWQAIAQDKSTRISRTPPFTNLVRCLPAPDAWPFITAKLQDMPSGTTARTSALLKAFAALLRNDDAALNDSLAAMKQLSQGPEPLEAAHFGIWTQLIASSGDGRITEELLGTPPFHQGTDPLLLPDLVALVGENSAKRLIGEALKRTLVWNVSQSGERTAALTRRLAVEMIDQLGTPQWPLAESLDGGPLFEALMHRFGRGDGSYLRDDRRARKFYLLGLIGHGRIDQAIAFFEADLKQEDSISSLPAVAEAGLRNAGKTTEAYAFVDQLVKTNHDLPNWDNFLGFANAVGNFAETAKLLEKVKSNTDIDPGLRQTIGRDPWKLYVSLGHVEEGIRGLRSKLADEVWTEPMANGDFLDTPWFFERSLKLANLGRVLHRESFIDEGLRDARAFFAMPDPVGQRLDYPRQPNCARMTAYNAENAGRPAVAEEMLQAQVLMDRRYELQQRGPLPSVVAKEARSAMRQRFAIRHIAGFTGENEAREDLVALAGFYNRHHRPADVVALLDHAVGWNVLDVGDLVTVADWSKTPFGYSVARAFYDLKRKDEARRVLDALLEAGTDYDPAYELFLELTPLDEAVTKFDHLFVGDPFEQRPLIWKAEALKRAGRLDEAESTVRAAIEIDPSDGGQSCGLRMRAYTTLADVLAAAGKNSEPYRSAVRAVRLAEEADEQVGADLISRSVPIYEKALGIYPDAYCIQARLAIQLSTVGRIEEAGKHYRRAFELMPESIGRAGGPCFGCERIFYARKSQEIADQVLVPQAEQPSARPQVFYLLGALRIQQGRYEEALDMMRRATALDPDYLNAWKQIGLELPKYLQFPHAERDKALLNILRLDPNRRHSDLKLDKIRDLAGLWTTLDDARARTAPVRTPCYPLAASDSAEQEIRNKLLPPTDNLKEEAADLFTLRAWGGSLERSQALPSPGDILVRQESMRTLIQALDTPISRR